MSDLVERIDDAFTRPGFEDAIRLVKDAVQEEMCGLDPGLGIEQTPFFNHAIYPDLVLRWHERGEPQQRPLFLRFEVSEGSVGSDLTRHREQSPLFVGLLDHRDEVDRGEVDQEDVTNEEGFGEEAEPRLGGTLLAEASAIDQLEAFARDRRDQMVATSAIMRGGHGRLSGEGAERLGGALSAGFEAAGEGRDAPLVITAFEQLESLVSDRQADQLATHLQLLWIGSGGDLGDLFGEERLLVDALNDLQLRELLEYLLRREEAPPVTTLRRFSSVIDPDRLGTLLGNFEGGHLGAFVEANLSRWTAKWVQVQDGTQTG